MAKILPGVHRPYRPEQATRMLRIAALPALLLLAGCIDSDDDNNDFVFPPVLALDFPALGVEIATDSTEMKLSGLVSATTSAGIATNVTVTVDDVSDADPVVLGPIENTEMKPRLFWQTGPDLGTSLALGLNAVTADASYGAGSLGQSMLVVRGSDWAWQAALQADDSQGPRRWLLLDTARRGLFEVDLATGEQTRPAGWPAIGATLDFIEPVDFVIDGSRALVVDKGLQAIVAVNLADGSRSVFSDAATPDASLPVFVEPIAIDIDGTHAFVLDRASTDLTAVALADGSRCLFDIEPFTDTSGAEPFTHPEIANPVDIAVQAGERLFISDRSLFITEPALLGEFEPGVVVGIAAITIPVDANIIGNPCDDGPAASRFLASPGDPVGADPAEDAGFSRIGHLAVVGDRLFAGDTGQFISIDESGFPSVISGAVLEVDISNGATDGDRAFLSAFQPNLDNLFSQPLGMAYDDRGNGQGSDDQLLVLDNQLGNIVAVEIEETEGGTAEEPVSLGRRSYVPGGAVLDAAAIEAGESSRSEALSVFPSVAIEHAVDTVDTGAGLLLLDGTQNALFGVSSGDGSRTRIDQALGSGDSEVEQQAARDAFNATRLEAPRVLAADSDGSAMYVVDIYDDTLVRVPLPLQGSSSVRVLASGEDAAASLRNSRAMAVFREIVADSETQTPAEFAYVLAPSALTAVDLAGDADTAANRSAFTPACALADAGALLLRHDLDENGLTDTATLLVAEASTAMLHVIDRVTGSCASGSYAYAGAGVDAAQMQVNDMVAVTQPDGSFALMMLDRGNGAIFRVPLEYRDDTTKAVIAVAGDAEILSSAAMPPGGGNVLRTPVGLGYSAADKLAYVFDSTLRSMHIVDVAERHPDTGRRLARCELLPVSNTEHCASPETDPFTPTISGRRVVISRGSAMACQPVADCTL